MSTIPLDIYDEMPRDMRRYLQYNGWHFNKKAYDFAVSLMRKRGSDGKKLKVEPLKKEDVDNILHEHGVSVDNKGNYDYMYAAMICKADLWGSSVEDDLHMARNIKDTCDDIDAADGSIMRCWYAKMTAAGISIPWEEFNE